jgi:hypothetical protein
VFERRVLRAQHVEFLLGEVADVQALAFGDFAADRRRSRAMVLTSVDLPWPLAPRMPMRWPAITERLMPRTMTVGGVPAGASSGAGSRWRYRPSTASGWAGWRFLEFEGEFGIGQHRRDLFHALQRLDPALRLLGLAGLGLEAVDEGLQVGDLVLPAWPSRSAAAASARRACLRRCCSCRRSAPAWRCRCAA